jgi:hypothetical protein
VVEMQPAAHEAAGLSLNRSGWGRAWISGELRIADFGWWRGVRVALLSQVVARRWSRRAPNR